MFSLPRLLLLIVATALAAPLFGEEPKADQAGASVAAETFLAGYINAGAANVEWVAKSKLVTAEFKATFKKAMSQEVVDVDPVLFAQDVPSKPFKATSSVVHGKEATVQVAAKLGSEPMKLTVTLVSKESHWLVAKTAVAK